MAPAQALPRPLRLGLVDYLNTAPLSFGLERDPRLAVRRESPAQVAAALHRGEIDLGQIPSIEYAAGDYRIVPGFAVTSRGPVQSVCLFLRRELADVRSIALDSSSCTSVTLLRLLLRERLGREPEYVRRAPDPGAMLSECDAALLIGDTALRFDETAAPGHSGLRRWDLAEAWRESTGLPFVFAFWAGRPGAAAPEHVHTLQAAARAGLAARDEIAATYGGSAALNADYLTHAIQFELGPEPLAGLREFYVRAHAAGLITRLPELKFYAQHS